MQPIHSAVDRELTWQQPRMAKRQFELRADEDVLATLRWQTLFGTLAVAESAQGRWTFKRAGFWRPRITVRVDGSEADLAIFEANWTGGGTLTMAGGSSYRWGAANFWHTQWHWSDTSGAPLVYFASHHGLTKMSARVEFRPASANVPDLTLLVTLGWYLLVLLTDDSSGATAGAVVATSSVATSSG